MAEILRHIIRSDSLSRTDVARIKENKYQTAIDLCDARAQLDAQITPEGLEHLSRCLDSYISARVGQPTTTLVLFDRIRIPFQES